MVKISADTAQAMSNIEKFGKKIQTTGQAISKTSTPFLVAGGAIVGALGLCVKAAAESEASTARLTAALKANNQYSDKTRDSMLALSTQMQNLSGISDEAVTDAQAYGLQLGLQADQIAGLTPKVLDFSTATGVDLNTSMKMAAMAMEGNTGMLKRYNIEIPKAEDGTVKFNDVLNAFSSYAGSAEAKGKTLQGQLAWVKETFGDLAEKVGNVLIPIMKDFIDKYVKPLIERLQKLSPEVVENGVKFVAMAGAILLTVGAVGKIIGLITSLGSLFTPTGLILFGIGAFIALIIAIVKHWDDIKKAFMGFYEGHIKPWLDPLLNGLQKVIGFFEKIVNFFKSVGTKIKESFSGTNTGMENAFANYAGGFQGGGSFTVSRPTMFMAGETGTERVSITPQGKQDDTLLREMLKELRKFNEITAPALGRQISLSVSGLGGKV